MNFNQIWGQFPILNFIDKYKIVWEKKKWKSAREVNKRNDYQREKESKVTDISIKLWKLLLLENYKYATKLVTAISKI